MKDIQRLQLERGLKKIIKAKREKGLGKQLRINKFYNFTMIPKKSVHTKKKYRWRKPSWSCLQKCFVSTKERNRLKKKIECLKDKIRKLKKEANKFKRKYLILKGKGEI